MQAARSSALFAPLQFGLAVEMHDQFWSMFLIDTLNKYRFSPSNLEVQKFERSAALFRGAENISPVKTEFVQFVADNVAHDVRSIDGLLVEWEPGGGQPCWKGKEFIFDHDWCIQARK